jgi:hypothetical protein
VRNPAWTNVIACAATIVLFGCGDADTNDNRGYTKAPLEEPGVLIKAESSSDMDALGTPVMPRDTLIPAEAAPTTTTK